MNSESSYLIGDLLIWFASHNARLPFVQYTNLDWDSGSTFVSASETQYIETQLLLTYTSMTTVYLWVARSWIISSTTILLMARYRRSLLVVLISVFCQLLRSIIWLNDMVISPGNQFLKISTSMKRICFDHFVSIVIKLDKIRGFIWITHQINSHHLDTVLNVVKKHMWRLIKCW